MHIVGRPIFLHLFIPFQYNARSPWMDIYLTRELCILTDYVVDACLLDVEICNHMPSQTSLQ